MKNAPVVIMDEPSAGLDRANQQLVLAGIAALVRQRTVVMATHRLDPSFMQWVDRIAVLDGGRLVEVGTYEELISRQGLFFEMTHRPDKACQVNGGAA
jgi:ABC-type multidrug transport system fused ATPase/permease subunit